ncbi:MAG: CPBP family intramembrane metalloprotease [Microcystis aeruginosa W13-16]|nr:CPBP family intramembrane metalloprotease [Microcystis aeruginosa W13-16]
MNQENKSTVIFSFLFFWTYCFLNGFFNPYLANYMVLFLITDILFWAIYPILNIYYLVFDKKIISFNDLGFKKSIFKRKSFLLIVFISFFVTIFLNNSYWNLRDILLQILPNNYFQSFDYQSIISKSGEKAIYLTFFFAFTAGFTEEIYYRSILRILINQGKFHILKYVFISSILFSMNHWEGGIINIISTLFFGISCSVLYLIFGNIWPLIIGHIITDIIAFFPYD